MNSPTLGSAALATLELCGPAVPSGTPEVLWWVVEVVDWVVEVLSPWRTSLTLLMSPDMMIDLFFVFV